MIKLSLNKKDQSLQCETNKGQLSVFPSAGSGKGSPARARPDSVGRAGTDGGSDERVLLSEPEAEQKKGTVSWPGEYDYGGISIRGIGQKEGAQVSFVVTADDLRCGFVSSPLEKWAEHEIELLGDLDVLVVPADDAKAAQEIIEEVDPRIVIPRKTKDDKTFKEVVAACGGKDVETVKEVKLKKSSLPTESREVYVLEG